MKKSSLNNSIAPAIFISDWISHPICAQALLGLSSCWWQRHNKVSASCCAAVLEKVSRAVSQKEVSDCLTHRKLSNKTHRAWKTTDRTHCCCFLTEWTSHLTAQIQNRFFKVLFGFRAIKCLQNSCDNR